MNVTDTRRPTLPNSLLPREVATATATTRDSFGPETTLATISAVRELLAGFKAVYTPAPGPESAAPAPGRCIASARAGVEFLRKRGLHVRPIATRVRASNPSLTALLLARAAVPELADEVDASLARAAAEPRAAGPWEIQIGFNRSAGEAVSKNEFDAHLVCLVEHKLIVDLSISAASRPARGMFFEPHALDVGASWSGGASIVERMSERSLVSYEALPNEKAYLRSPAWRSETWRDVVHDLDRHAQRRGAAGS